MKITKEQFTALVNRNEDRLRHLCRVYAPRRADENDIYQEILIAAWQSLPSFEGNANLDTWLYRLAVNTAISCIRKKQTRQDYYEAYRHDKKGGEPGTHTMHSNGNNEQLDALYQAISSLDATEKAIITMYLEDFSYAEISYVTDITENYVGVKLNRIKKKLANKISSNGIE
ncbi:MAG: RNA polymerase sigma factor [Fodinibius sp.]|nr:RNA polymerase sigma factor [Fodinibius sp.]